MTQIADHISVRPACTCNDPSTTSSSSDSLYASVMAPSQLIVANSAAEYSSKAKINVSPDVMFTIDEARQYIAQKAGKTIDALHPSTLIPQELCTRTADGKDASTVRQNQIRKMLREVCVVIETLPDKREEEDGMIKTRGIQYFRDNYRTIFDRLVDKLEVAIPELQLCAGHWKALQLISRRLKSFSEKDTRRNKFIEKQKLKVKRELQEGSVTQEVSTSDRNETDQSPDGEAPASSDPKGKGKMATTSGAKSKSKRSPAVVEPTTTGTTAEKPAESRPRPRPVSKQRQRKNKVAEVESIHNKLLADGDGNPSSDHSTSPLSADADNTRQTSSGLTPNLDRVQLSSAPYSSLPRFPLPRTATPSPVSSRPSHARLPPLRPLFETMKMTPRAVEYTGQRFSGSQQDYDYRQGQGQGSRPYGYQQGHERGQSQGYENPSYGTNSYSINPYGANPYNNPYRLSPPPTHHSTQA
ncbi:unnamed protein product [Tilletia laevis]|nr:unnamed protein product [Tilletia laevis]